MKHMLIILLILSLVCVGSSAASDTALPEQQYGQNQIMIKIDTSLTTITSLVPAEDVLYNYSSLVPGLYLISIPSGYSIAEAILYYEEMNGVIYAEPDYLIYVEEEQTPIPNNDTPRSSLPILGIVIGFGAALMFYRKV